MYDKLERDLFRLYKTDIYLRLDKELGAKVATRLLDCEILRGTPQLRCWFASWWMTEPIFVYCFFPSSAAMCPEWTVTSKMPSNTVPTSRGGGSPALLFDIGRLAWFRRQWERLNIGSYRRHIISNYYYYFFFFLRNFIDISLCADPMRRNPFFYFEESFSTDDIQNALVGASCNHYFVCAIDQKEISFGHITSFTNSSTRLPIADTLPYDSLHTLTSLLYRVFQYTRDPCDSSCRTTTH